jgi:hypothetical protein
MEPDVVSLACERALTFGVASRVWFGVDRLTLERDQSEPRFDALIFLAAQQVFHDPKEHTRWMQTYVTANGIGLVDRTIAVLPGRELHEAERSEAFRSALGPSAEEISLRTITLSRDASLRSADLLVDHANDDKTAHDLRRARQSVIDGAMVQSCSALYLVRNSS